MLEEGHPLYVVGLGDLHLEELIFNHVLLDLFILIGEFNHRYNLSLLSLDIGVGELTSSRIVSEHLLIFYVLQVLLLPSLDKYLFIRLSLESWINNKLRFGPWLLAILDMKHVKRIVV